MLAKQLHEPGDVGQPVAKLPHLVGIVQPDPELEVLGFGRLTVASASLGTQLPPAASHFFLRPGGDQIGTVAEDEVEMIVHRRKATDLDPEGSSQRLQTLLDPGLAVSVVVTRQRIDAAQERSTDATVKTVIVPDLIPTDRLLAPGQAWRTS